MLTKCHCLEELALTHIVQCGVKDDQSVKEELFKLVDSVLDRVDYTCHRLLLTIKRANCPLSFLGLFKEANDVLWLVLLLCSPRLVLLAHLV